MTVNAHVPLKYNTTTMSVSELRAELKKLGLESIGFKSELVERLNNYDKIKTMKNEWINTPLN